MHCTAGQDSAKVSSGNTSTILIHFSSLHKSFPADQAFVSAEKEQDNCLGILVLLLFFKLSDRINLSLPDRS